MEPKRKREKLRNIERQERATRQIDRPMPNEAAKRGLLHVDTMEVSFNGASDRDQEEALNHINELIDFWNLKYKAWKP